ncbi:hypothetical protein ABZ249_21025 [Nocardiopsis sp. NPDC006139]|uniref:hypothetical protein n=1 Tax=Nocardiopsis sp. NPDC006139 TaxID=3154578 RepID=UPI0033AC2D2B
MSEEPPAERRRPPVAGALRTAAGVLGFCGRVVLAAAAATLALACVHWLDGGPMPGARLAAPLVPVLLVVLACLGLSAAKVLLAAGATLLICVGLMITLTVAELYPLLPVIGRIDTASLAQWALGDRLILYGLPVLLTALLFVAVETNLSGLIPVAGAPVALVATGAAVFGSGAEPVPALWDEIVRGGGMYTGYALWSAALVAVTRIAILVERRRG